MDSNDSRLTFTAEDQDTDEEVANPFVDDPTLGITYHYHHIGLSRGIAAGELDGWRDGYVTGLRQGAQLSSEIGYYEGFTRAWIAILEQTKMDASTTRKVTALKSLMEMCASFPSDTKDVKEDEDVKQKLARIRAKYRQLNSLVCGSKSKMRGPSWGSKFAEEINGSSSTPDIEF